MRPTAGQTKSRTFLIEAVRLPQNCPACRYPRQVGPGPGSTRGISPVLRPCLPDNAGMGKGGNAAGEVRVQPRSSGSSFAAAPPLREKRLERFAIVGVPARERRAVFHDVAGGPEDAALVELAGDL